MLNQTMNAMELPQKTCRECLYFRPRKSTLKGFDYEGICTNWQCQKTYVMKNDTCYIKNPK